MCSIYSYPIIFPELQKDKGQESARAHLVGKWNFTKFLYTEYENNVRVKSSVITISSDQAYWDFRADGTISVNDAGLPSANGTYELAGDGNSLSTITTRQGVTLTMQYQVKILNSTDMAIHYESSDVQAGKTYRRVDEYTFKKDSFLLCRPVLVSVYTTSP